MFDLGLIVPLCLIAATKVWRGQAMGHVIALPLLGCIVVLFPWIVLATIFQIRAGVTFTPPEMIGPIAGFAVLGLGGAWFLRRARQGTALTDERYQGLPQPDKRATDRGMAKLTAELIETQVAQMARSRHVHGAVLGVHHAQSGAQFVSAAGNLRPESRFFAASVTKLIVTTVVMRLVDRGELALDDPMARYVPAELIAGLHVMKGVDRTSEITIRHLISNQTGLRDYFSLKGPGGRTYMAALMAGEDSAWPLEHTLGAVRGLPARFVPGAPCKVDYSDTNYQLIGRVLEIVTGKHLPTLFADEVFAPLGLEETYIYADPSDDSPALFHAGAKALHLPRYIASISAEGGMVSTAAEMLRISEAFFAGRFFDSDTLLAQQNWRMLFWPGQFYFGLGLEKLWTPWFVSPFRPIRDVLGCWGQTGAFLFHHPATGLHFAGTVNQASGWGHASAVRAMLRIIKTMQA